VLQDGILGNNGDGKSWPFLQIEFLPLNATKTLKERKRVEMLAANIGQFLGHFGK
jgi:hypothetical protein